jgi:hypothetical protein
LPLLAVELPVFVALPVVPDVDEPPEVVFESPDPDELCVVPFEVELPVVPPVPVSPVVAVPPAECNCAARTSSISISGSHSTAWRVPYLS